MLAASGLNNSKTANHRSTIRVLVSAVGRRNGCAGAGGAGLPRISRSTACKRCIVTLSSNFS
jgi:hypothetical protein